MIKSVVYAVTITYLFDWRSERVIEKVFSNKIEALDYIRNLGYTEEKDGKYYYSYGSEFYSIEEWGIN